MPEESLDPDAVYRRETEWGTVDVRVKEKRDNGKVGVYDGEVVGSTSPYVEEGDDIAINEKLFEKEYEIVEELE